MTIEEVEQTKNSSRFPWPIWSIILIFLVFGPIAGFLVTWQNIKRLNKSKEAKEFLKKGGLTLFLLSLFGPFCLVAGGTASFKESFVGLAVTFLPFWIYVSAPFTITYFSYNLLVSLLFPLWFKQKFSKELTNTKFDWTLPLWGLVGLMSAIILLSIIIVTDLVPKEYSLRKTNLSQTNPTAPVKTVTPNESPTESPLPNGKMDDTKEWKKINFSSSFLNFSLKIPSRWNWFDNTLTEDGTIKAELFPELAGAKENMSCNEYYYRLINGGKSIDTVKGDKIDFSTPFGSQEKTEIISINHEDWNLLIAGTFSKEQGGLKYPRFYCTKEGEKLFLVKFPGENKKISDNEQLLYETLLSSLTFKTENSLDCDTDNQLGFKINYSNDDWVCNSGINGPNYSLQLESKKYTVLLDVPSSGAGISYQENSRSPECYIGIGKEQTFIKNEYLESVLCTETGKNKEINGKFVNLRGETVNFWVYVTNSKDKSMSEAEKKQILAPFSWWNTSFTNWKVYSDKDNGLSFRYPASFKLLPQNDINTVNFESDDYSVNVFGDAGKMFVIYPQEERIINGIKIPFETVFSDQGNLTVLASVPLNGKYIGLRFIKKEENNLIDEKKIKETMELMIFSLIQNSLHPN